MRPSDRPTSYYEESFDDFLDDSYEWPDFGGGYTLQPSKCLKGADPIAYREGLLDYIDSLDRDYEEENE